MQKLSQMDSTFVQQEASPRPCTSAWSLYMTPRGAWAAGPQMPLYLAGAKVHLITGMGPLLHMMGLFHAVMSGGTRITINFVSCRSMMPDPQKYRECLQLACDELAAAAD